MIKEEEGQKGEEKRTWGKGVRKKRGKGKETDDRRGCEREGRGA